MNLSVCLLVWWYVVRVWCSGCWIGWRLRLCSVVVVCCGWRLGFISLRFWVCMYVVVLSVVGCLVVIWMIF